jgi:uncharacterized membrane protein
MRIVRTAVTLAEIALDAVLYLVVDRFFWSVNKAVALLAAVGFVTLLGQPIVYPAATTIAGGVLLALDTIAWFLDREYQRRATS